MKWLDRALVVSPYYYGLCVDEADFHRELRRLNVPRDDWPPFLKDTSDATAQFFMHGDGGLACIVCMRNPKGKTVPQIHAMLVHEAVHIWQAVRKDLGELEPSSEFEAYSVQTISQRLMESYAESKKVKR